MNRKNRTLIVIGIAVLLGAAAAIAVYRAVQRIPVRQIEVASVFTVVAARPIPVGTLITKDHVKVIAWPARNQIAGAYSKVEDVVNRGAITGIAENEPLTESKLAQAGIGGGLPPRIPTGMRAVSVKVNEVVGVAGFVLPGNRVDLLVTVEDPGTRGSQITRAVVNNLEVLTAGTRYDNETAQEGKAVQSSVVTLLATPPDAEKIALAATEGRIMLTLRNPLDTLPTETNGVRLAGLLGTPAPPPVEKAVRGRRVMVAQKPPTPAAPPQKTTVEVLRAAKRTEEPIKGGGGEEPIKNPEDPNRIPEEPIK